VDRRADIWAAGAVLHEMLTGRPPMGQAERLPEGLGRIVRKALAAEPGERYQHIEDLVVDLVALRQGLSKGPQAFIAQPRRRQFCGSWGWCGRPGGCRWFEGGRHMASSVSLVYGTGPDPLHRGPSLGEPFGRCGTGTLLGWDDRRADHESGENQRPEGDRAKVGNAIQERQKAAAGNRPRVGSGAYSMGQCCVKAAACA